jgi:hypothetical protein
MQESFNKWLKNNDIKKTKKLFQKYTINKFIFERRGKQKQKNKKEANKKKKDCKNIRKYI